LGIIPTYLLRSVVDILYLAHKTEFGISGFGVSVTTMEEVFIKVGEGVEEQAEQYATLNYCLYS